MRTRFLLYLIMHSLYSIFVLYPFIWLKLLHETSHELEYRSVHTFLQLTTDADAVMTAVALSLLQPRLN